MTTPIDTHSEQYRLECLARYWLTRPRANAQAWLNSQKIAFREQMRELMNQEQKKRSESRNRPKPMSAPKTTQTRRKNDAPVDAPTQAERRAPASTGGQTSLEEMLGGFRA